MADKKNPVSLAGMQAAINEREEISQEAIFASNVAMEHSNQKLSTTRKNAIYKLVDTNVRGNLYLDLIDDVPARSGTGNERIRVLTGVESIWQKDQKDIDKDYIRSNRRQLLFQKGMAIVPDTDHQVNQFMGLTNGNIDNPNPVQHRRVKFFKWNPEKQAEELLKQEDKRIEAILKAEDVAKDTPSMMRKHALYLGIPMIDSVGEPLTEGGLKVKYRQYANANPKYFISSLAMPEVEVNYLVKKAIGDARIDIGKQPNTAYWADGGLITKIPMSQTAHKYLVDFALDNSDAGKEFLEMLKAKIV